ncbi:hypothetical protein OGAPHI_003401 [Ogataea philodendri]|uniref:Uncharacterized protein n=1 Tax=Ogataea philodendri TaxID=1378263 RepID=A0A9P8T6G7_9ASCO|nr:uncharacterized protein OGAPHI_003401 [Ogataea philodendri]KAH3666951.1 hypothetical protein OGAPHI_003401 [Ogataea philodendri]
MCGQVVDLVLDRLQNKRNLGNVDTFNRLLDHMVTVLVLDKNQNVALQLVHDLQLFLNRKRFQTFLDNSASIHLQRQVIKTSSHRLEHDFSLHIVAVLEILLDHIVSKHVCHQVDGMITDLVKNDLLVSLIGKSELLLNKPRTVLVLGELETMAMDIFQSVLFVLVASELLEQRRSHNVLLWLHWFWRIGFLQWLTRRLQFWRP